MKSLIAANWKMNPITEKEAKELFDLVDRGVKGIKRVKTIICPPFVYLPVLNGVNVSLGSQNLFWEEKGAYTGEVSLKMIKGLGCQYAIVGHSERRKYFKETDETVNKKIIAALKEKITPIFCIGETEKEREKIESILRRQIEVGLRGVSNSKFSEVIIAYEPVWAIGTGNPCGAEEAQTANLLIRKIISKISSSAVAKKVNILYGGSANSGNARSYLEEAGFQGLLVGGASLKAKEFISIVKEASRIR